MYAALLPAIATLLVATLISTLILGQRERSPIHWTCLALLVAIVSWTGGVIWRMTHPDDAGVRQGLHFAYLGIHAAPVLWFWLAALYTRSPLAEGHLWLKAGSLVLPAVGYLAWLTNGQHGLYASEVSHAAMMAGPRSWGGPAFWMGLAVSYVLAAAGTLLLLSHAWRLRGSRERGRGVKLAAAALAPILLSQVYIFRLLPVPYDLTPTGLCITMLIFYGVLAREGIFETLPLARRDVIEDLHDGVVLADPDGIVVDVNPAGRRILGIEAGSPVGVSLEALLSCAAVEERRDELERRVARVLSEGEPGVCRFDTPAGHRVELTVAPVRASLGRPAGIYAVLRDCTDQHRYEQIVRQTQKLESVGVLAAGLAHEVNNPLAFVRANLGTLQQMAGAVERNLSQLPEKDAEELADLREVLDESLEGIERISRIVSRLRRFSRAPDGAALPVEPNASIEEAVRFAQLDLPAGLEIATRLDPELPPVQGSRDGLTQVLLNLLLNAAQAVAERPDGRVEVESRCEADTVVVEVCDNGPGVSEAVERHIFDPFFTTKPPDQGTGLGLAIAFDIAREHGGRLELCPHSGPGACFRLTLPAAADPEPA